MFIVHQIWYNTADSAGQRNDFFFCSSVQPSRDPNFNSTSANCFTWRSKKSHSWQIWDNAVTGKPSPNLPVLLKADIQMLHNSPLKIKHLTLMLWKKNWCFSDGFVSLSFYLICWNRRWDFILIKNGCSHSTMIPRQVQAVTSRELPGVQSQEQGLQLGHGNSHYQYNLGDTRIEHSLPKQAWGYWWIAAGHEPETLIASNSKYMEAVACIKSSLLKNYKNTMYW